MRKLLTYIILSLFTLIVSFLLINQFTNISSDKLRFEQVKIEEFLRTDDDFVCILKAKKSVYKLGEQPEVEVQIYNKTDSTALFVGSLDGSDVGFRLPLCYYSVKHQLWGDIGFSQRRCGNVNNLREKDFIEVESKDIFNPFMNIDNKGFFNSYKMYAEQFWIPGEYQIQFRYSTIPTDNIFYDNIELLTIDESFKEWYFKEGREAEYYLEKAKAEEINRLWNRIPKIDLESNTITIKYKI